MMRLAALFALASGPLCAAASDDASTLAALAADEECASAEDVEACALNALQLRGLRMSARGASEWGSCAHLGCGVAYKRGQACQCNVKCAKYGNCCSDYYSACKASPAVKEFVDPAPASKAAATGSVHGHPKAGAMYPEHKGFTLSLVEEFDEPIDLDNDPVWTWSDGGLIEGQIRFVKENIQFRDGKMVIEVLKKRANVDLCSAAEGKVLREKDLSSGEMRTRHNIFRYGRYEVRMKAPSVQPNDTKTNGNYIATMFVFRDGKDKHWREIDFEITGDSPGSVTTNVLSADNTIEWRAGIQATVHHEMPFNDREDFHVYAFEWLPDSITWYVDGKKVRQYKGGQVSIPELSGKIMMNTWVYDERGLFGGPQVENDRFPMQTEYDWFRFYKWDGDTHYPCAGLGSSCLTADDRYLAKNNPCDGIANEGLKFGRPPCETHCR